jgi:catechol 2,3-dioxygenase-like lactoylglutathione lyase family enzyme
MLACAPVERDATLAAGAVPKGAQLPVSLNHVIVFAEDKHESAAFFTWLFALPEATSWGPFRIVEFDNEGSVLFAEPGIEIQPQHLAFKVSEYDFDGIYGRMLESGLEHWPDPQKATPGAFNTNNGGRGVYFNDPAGHNLEVLTRP